MATDKKVGYWQGNKLWTPDEEEALMKGLKKGKSCVDMTKELEGRTEKALKMRAIKLIRDEVKSSGAKTEKVLDKYGISLEDYKAELERIDKAEAKKKEKSVEKKETIASLTARVVKLEEELEKIKAEVGMS